MRFLKNKIALAKASADIQAMQRRSVRKNPTHKSESQEQDQTQKRTRVPGATYASESTRSIKNISKNFARAICSFAISDMALPYLNPLLRQEYVTREDFINFVNEIKPMVVGLFKFRSVLVTYPKDNQEVRAFKEVFRRIGEAFIKFFSVNWIYNGKLQHKEAHLRYRFKMLRAIRYPEIFTFMRKKQTKPTKDNEKKIKP